MPVLRTAPVLRKLRRVTGKPEAVFGLSSWEKFSQRLSMRQKRDGAPDLGASQIR